MDIQSMPYCSRKEGCQLEQKSLNAIMNFKNNRNTSNFANHNIQDEILSKRILNNKLQFFGQVL
jgi:hypothetical protein